MKKFNPLVLIIMMAFLWSCSKDDDTSSIKSNDGSNHEIGSIEIKNYVFNFPSDFVLEEEQGIDSYIGKINGSGISISFDYGWYTSPSNNLPANEFIVSVDEINGHYRQIVIPADAKKDYTKIHLFNKSDTIKPVHNSLTLSTKNLTNAEQEMILEVFRSVQVNQ